LPGFFGRFTSLYQKSKLSTTLFVKRTTKLCRHEGTPRHEKVPLSRPAPGQRRDWHGGSRPQPPGDRHPPSPRARRPNGKSRGAPNALRCLENKTVCIAAFVIRIVPIDQGVIKVNGFFRGTVNCMVTQLYNNTSRKHTYK